jgi:hypothetical protein
MESPRSPRRLFVATVLRLALLVMEVPHSSRPSLATICSTLTTTPRRLSSVTFPRVPKKVSLLQLVRGIRAFQVTTG